MPAPRNPRYDPHNPSGPFSSYPASPVNCIKCRYDLTGLDLATSRHCPECGSALGRSVRACARCSSRFTVVTLRRVALGKVRGWTCTVCHGIGFDSGELVSTLARRRHLNQPPDNDPTIEIDHQFEGWCVRCRAPMAAAAIDTNVIIDRCPTCSFVWIDRREFNAVLEIAANYASYGPLPDNFEQLLTDPKANHPMRAVELGGMYAPTALEFVMEVLMMLLTRRP